MIKKHLIFLICLYHLIITSSNAWRPYVVEFTNISTFSHVNFIEMNSSISTNNSISISMNFLQDVSNAYARAVIKLKSSATGDYDTVFINKTINVCEFFKNRRYEPILQLLYKVLNKNNSFPSNCPLRRAYSIKDILVDTEDLPPMMPSSFSAVEISIMTKSGNKYKLVSGIDIYYQVRQVHLKNK